MDIILIPGLWLTGDSWTFVVPHLEAAGHRAVPLTLPGTGSDADRGAVGLEDQVAAIVAAIDDAEAPVILVGHSLGAGLAHIAVDRRPDRVARVIDVGGWPANPGEPLAGGFATDGDDLPLLPWEAFDEADLTDLDEDLRSMFLAVSSPSPARLTTDVVELRDPRRHDVPLTVVCTEFTAEMLQGWMEDDAPPLRELAAIRHLEYVDLPTGHWPQLTRPEDLARIIVDRAFVPRIDEHGRLQPPWDASDVMTALGFLDYQRQTLEWKTRGLDAAGLNQKVAGSSLTLGGLLKHIALVEEVWFSRALHGRDRLPPWSEVDWKANPDWDFESAADDEPDELRTLWRRAVLRSKALLAPFAGDADGLDHHAARVAPDGEKVTLRWIVHHMIEEYARHNGHADLIREAVDGETGE